MDINDRVDKVEKRLEKIEDEMNKSIPEIQAGISEIKAILQERPAQEDLKNEILSKDIANIDKRVTKVEDNLNWLWKTVGGAIITIIVGAIVFTIKMM